MTFITKIRLALFWTGLFSIGVAAFLVATGYYLGGAVWCGMGCFILYKIR